MIEGTRIKLIPIDVEMIDSLLISDQDFYQKYGLINDGGEFLNPSPDYLHKIRARLIEHPEEYPLAVDQLIVLKDTSTVIGTIYYKYLPKDGVSEIGYGMSPQYEGNGYMSEAIYLMLIFGKHNGINMVVADTMIDNVKSINTLRRSGFVLDKVESDKMMFRKYI